MFNSLTVAPEPRTLYKRVITYSFVTFLVSLLLGFGFQDLSRLGVQVRFVCARASRGVRRRAVRTAFGLAGSTPHIVYILDFAYTHIFTYLIFVLCNTVF